MSMEIDDSVLHGVSRSPPEICEESAKRQKTESERENQLKPESSDSDGSDLEDGGGYDLEWLSQPIEYLQKKFDNDNVPRHFVCSRFEYKNEAQIKREQAIKVAVAEYLNSSRGLSPYDAISIPPLAWEAQYGHNWPRPLYIRGGDDDQKLILLVNLSKTALAYYNDKNQGAEKYEFVDFVKAAWKKIPLGSRYITFKAKEVTKDVDPSEVKIFQAHVVHRGGLTEVRECSIKPGN